MRQKQPEPGLARPCLHRAAARLPNGALFKRLESYMRRREERNRRTIRRHHLRSEELGSARLMDAGIRGAHEQEIVNVFYGAESEVT
jgi:hypothetical protein